VFHLYNLFVQFQEYYCDGEDDCKDGSDEPEGCIPASSDGKCGAHEFHCGGDSCIPADWTCNGHADCFDGADEADSLCRKY
jgi:hypothetical protein